MLLPVPRGNDKGFTMLELLVSLVIMTIGILALLQVVTVSIAVNSGNKMRNDAIQICDQTLGELRSKLYTDADLTPGTTNATVTQKNALGSVSYTVTKTVTTLTNHALGTDNIAGAKHVMITVSWSEKGVVKNHSLTSTIIEKAN